MDGDRIALDVDVGPGAAAFLSTQASTKVYRSPRGTSSELHARVATEGLLAVIPDPVVCFAASRYRQVQSFDLSADSGLVLVDWVSSGRHASGERWAFHEYVARLRARVEGKLVLHDALALRGDDGDLRDRLGRFDVLAVVLILGTRLRERAAEVAARVAEMPARPPARAARRGDAGWGLRVPAARGRDVGRTGGAHGSRVSRVSPGPAGRRSVGEEVVEGEDVNSQKSQLPIPKVSRGRSRSEFHPASSRQVLWELGLGCWELTGLHVSGACQLCI